MPQRFVCFVNSHILLHGLRFPLRFVFLQVEISSSCYCRGRAPPPTGKCFGCHLADIRQRCLPSFSPVPEGSGIRHRSCALAGFVVWSCVPFVLQNKQTDALLCSCPSLLLESLVPQSSFCLSVCSIIQFCLVYFS